MKLEANNSFGILELIFGSRARTSNTIQYGQWVVSIDFRKTSTFPLQVNENPNLC